MIQESGARRAPNSGKLRARPLAFLLAQANERCVTGTITVAYEGRRATILLRGGRVLSVRTSTPGPFLSAILFDLGFVDKGTIQRTLVIAARTKRLHGDVLLHEKAITRELLDAALVEQTQRKLGPLFDLPDEATFGVREDAALVTEARDGDRPAIDPWRLIWRGMRDRAPNDHVQRAIARLDGTITVALGPKVDRLGLDAEEAAFCAELEDKSSSASRIIATSPLGERRTEMLLYCLALAQALAIKSVHVEGPRDLGREGVRTLARRLGTQPMNDPWGVLGLRRGASVEAARAAYLRLSRVWRPDRLPHDLVDLGRECDAVYRAMTEAHRIIVEEGARRLSLVPPPSMSGDGRATMRDVDAALGRNDLRNAADLARSLRSTGADGPRARAVLAWCEAGGETANDQNCERAIAAFDKILAGDPECTRALVYRGRYAERLGRLENARADFRKALRIDPNNTDAQLGLRLVALRTFGDEALEGSARCRPTLPSSGLHPFQVRAR